MDEERQSSGAVYKVYRKPFFFLIFSHRASPLDSSLSPNVLLFGQLVSCPFSGEEEDARVSRLRNCGSNSLGLLLSWTFYYSISSILRFSSRKLFLLEPNYKKTWRKRKARLGFNLEAHTPFPTFPMSILHMFSLGKMGLMASSSSSSLLWIISASASRIKYKRKSEQSKTQFPKIQEWVETMGYQQWKHYSLLPFYDEGIYSFETHPAHSTPRAGKEKVPESLIHENDFLEFFPWFNEDNSIERRERQDSNACLA